MVRIQASGCSKGISHARRCGENDERGDPDDNPGEGHDLRHNPRIGLIFLMHEVKRTKTRLC